MSLTPPAPLSYDHDISEFDSGEPLLDRWLMNRALKNQKTGASRTFVTCLEKRVVAYYSLASSAISVETAKSRFRRNMPDPVPVVLLGRLAIDLDWQGKGLSRALVRDASLRVLQAADVIGIRGLVIHALSDETRTLYEHLGFIPSPIDPFLLMATLTDLKVGLDN